MANDWLNEDNILTSLTISLYVLEPIKSNKNSIYIINARVDLNFPKENFDSFLVLISTLELSIKYLIGNLKKLIKII